MSIQLILRSTLYFPGSIQFVLSNSQCFRVIFSNTQYFWGVDTAYTNFYAVFSGVDNDYTKQYAVLSGVDTTYTEEYAVFSGVDTTCSKQFTVFPGYI